MPLRQWEKIQELLRPGGVVAPRHLNVAIRK
jgi:hypothetical protein